MIFYTYTIKKMLKAPSTWITFIISATALWIFTISAFIEKMENNLPITFILISFFSMPLPNIFLTYQTLKIFRDEIENQTMLSLQTKPITRKRMVLEGAFALWCSILAMLLLSILLPGLLLGINNSKMINTALSVFATYLLLFTIISMIAFQLSLKVRGKSFVGIMLGLFGTLFFILFSVSFSMKSYSSIQKNSISFMTSLEYNPNNFKSPFQKSKNKKNHITITSDENNKEANYYTKSLVDLYKKAKANNNPGIYDILQWFNPTSHWMTMFGSITDMNNKLDRSGNIINAMFSSKSYYFRNIKIDSNKKNLSFDIVEEETYPVYYPFIVWTAIGLVLVPLSIRSIKRKNIT